MGVIALSDPEDQLLYTDLVVDYDLRYDLDTPSVAMQQAVHFMHKAAYTHVILQQASNFTLQTLTSRAAAVACDDAYGHAWPHTDALHRGEVLQPEQNVAGCSCKIV